MRVNDPNLNVAALNSTNTSGAASSGAASTGKTAQLDPVKINTSSVAGNRSSERIDEV